MLMSTFWFSLLYVVVKHLSQSYTIFQISFFRCLFALAIGIGMVFGMGGWRSLYTTRFRGHFFRAACGTAAMLTLFYAYHLLPMATVVAISFSAPMFTTLLSIIILREKVKWQNWTALIAGFIGILVIAAPSDAKAQWLGFFVAFVSTIFRSLSMTGIRALGKTEPASTTAFYFALQSSIFTGLPMPWVWQTPGWTDFLMLAGGGICAGMGQYFVTRAYQYAPAAIVSPFDYATIVWAVLFGFVFWNELPGLHIVIGSAIVILAGLFILYYEGKKGKGALPDALT